MRWHHCCIPGVSVLRDQAVQLTHAQKPPIPTSKPTTCPISPCPLNLFAHLGNEPYITKEGHLVSHLSPHVRQHSATLAARARPPIPYRATPHFCGSQLYDEARVVNFSSFPITLSRSPNIRHRCTAASMGRSSISPRLFSLHLFSSRSRSSTSASSSSKAVRQNGRVPRSGR
jgi:hypothetical protein